MTMERSRYWPPSPCRMAIRFRSGRSTVGQKSGRRARVACHYHILRVDRVVAAHRDRDSICARRNGSHRRTGLRRNSRRFQRLFKDAQQADETLVGLERRDIEVERRRRRPAEYVPHEVGSCIHGRCVADADIRKRHELVQEVFYDVLLKAIAQRHIRQPIVDGQRPVGLPRTVQQSCGNQEPAKLHQTDPIVHSVLGKTADQSRDPE